MDVTAQYLPSMGRIYHRLSSRLFWMDALDTRGQSQPIVIKPDGRLAVHSHCGNRVSCSDAELGLWYPRPRADAVFGVKFAMTDAMQSGTLEVPLQFGGPGATGLVKSGDVPN
jgi:hypothetical protein